MNLNILFQQIKFFYSFSISSIFSQYIKYHRYFRIMVWSDLTNMYTSCPRNIIENLFY